MPVGGATTATLRTTAAAMTTVAIPPAVQQILQILLMFENILTPQQLPLLLDVLARLIDWNSTICFRCFRGRPEEIELLHRKNHCSRSKWRQPDCYDPYEQSRLCDAAKSQNATLLRVLRVSVYPVSTSEPAGLSGGTIAGIVIGSIVGAALIFLAVYFFIRWRKNKAHVYGIEMSKNPGAQHGSVPN